MKKLMLFALLVLGMGMSTASAQVVKQGNVFSVPSSSRSGVRDTVVTKYQFETRNGNKPIILNKANGVCYLYLVSAKSGKGYRRFLNDEKTIEISKQIAAEYGVKFTWVPRKKSSK